MIRPIPRLVRAQLARAGRRAAPILVALLLALTLAQLGHPTINAATPSPSPAPGGDTRSPGEGPGFVGAPAFAIGGVLFIAALAVAGTLTYVRLTGGPRRDPEETDEPIGPWPR